jgi:hypothetical protein
VFKHLTSAISYTQREKTSQAFRDALQNKYRSSNAFKHKMRRMLPAPAGHISRNLLLPREFCADKRHGNSIPFDSGNCLGRAVAFEHLVSPIGGGCEVKNSNSSFCRSTTMEVQTLEGSIQCATPVLFTDRPVTTPRDVSSLSLHTRHTECIDNLWQHSKSSPIDSHKREAQLVDMLYSVAERFDSAGDPLEPLPFERLSAAANAP